MFTYFFLFQKRENKDGQVAVAPRDLEDQW